MKICVECRYIRPSNFSETKYHECAHPECRHVVSGRAQTCVDMRKKGAPCGPEGKHHDEK